MNRLPEITDILTKLALHLQSELPSPGDEEVCDPAISSLNQSLNLNEVSRVRVLDTALSLMCFKAPKVFGSEIEYMVNTVVTVLSSTISCKVLRFQKEEFLQVGSSISSCECSELVRVCVDVLDRLEGHASLFHLLFSAILRVASSSSCYQTLFPLNWILNVKSSFKRNLPISKLHRLLQEEITFNNQGMALRLHLWYLDPLTLKHDISRILQETTQRPFICLKKELHERINWRSLIICLVLSPTMFIETRGLLHKWFLLTGSTSILQLQVGLVSSILDALAQPMWWGIPAEVGSNLPFSRAYFPNNHRLLVALAGSISGKSFLHLVHLVTELLPHVNAHSNPTVRQRAAIKGMIDWKFIWAMLIDFPCWFFFAAALLFSGENCEVNFLSNYTSQAGEDEQTHDVEPYRAAAARYLAWIIRPTDESHCDFLVDFLDKISGSWAMKKYCLGMHNNEKVGCKKKLKFKDIKKDYLASNEYDGQTVRLWIKEFQDGYLRYWNKTGNGICRSEARAPHAFSPQQNLLFRRIPLGIFIGYYSSIEEEGCELLLHYAATGAILLSGETQVAGLEHTEQKPRMHSNDKGPISWFKESQKKETVARACLVLELFDAIEDISASIFEVEERRLGFMYRLKVKAVKYLVKCIEELLQCQHDEDEGGVLMLMDLHRRLVQWSHHFPASSALDDVVRTLNCKISSKKVQ
ncbi:PREDICTED: uncharacterized protein LOC104586620 isoform X1 [Nelumbo nucifera]|uniref:Uncharacterized protein LOC104586620 isoform X1 n=1 Tax=Nelumbo nucifera TaxID=4432 RepID=A0A1U7Z4E8_NELNU|nr:PREDICTED: uncharacterized protein LOC104586620 isoform X1 [Nelumbo nucifera]